MRVAALGGAASETAADDDDGDRGSRDRLRGVVLSENVESRRYDKPDRDPQGRRCVGTGTRRRVPFSAELSACPDIPGQSRWPSIPNDWVLGEVSSISVDSRDHIWVLHRPRSIPEAQRAKAAPPVLEFDTSGKLLSSWGGPGEGYDWPEREHGIFVDAKNFMWISGNGGWPKPTVLAAATT